MNIVLYPSHAPLLSTPANNVSIEHLEPDVYGQESSTPVNGLQRLNVLTWVFRNPADRLDYSPRLRPSASLWELQRTSDDPERLKLSEASRDPERRSHGNRFDLSRSSARLWGLPGWMDACADGGGRGVGWGRDGDAWSGVERASSE